MVDIQETLTVVIREVEVLHLQPGDRLGLKVPLDTDEETIKELADFLDKRWPEFKPIVFAGVELVVVCPEEE